MKRGGGGGGGGGGGRRRYISDEVRVTTRASRMPTVKGTHDLFG